jgi:hypothetical protein
MAKDSYKSNTEGDAVPRESVELEGNIVTAAKALLGGANFERGFPEPEMAGWERLKMDNLGGRKK